MPPKRVNTVVRSTTRLPAGTQILVIKGTGKKAPARRGAAAAQRGGGLVGGLLGSIAGGFLPF